MCVCTVIVVCLARVTHPVSTTTKSMTFHPFLRYEFLWKANPSARIFIPDSKQKIPMKYGSVSSWAERGSGQRKQIEIDIRSQLKVGSYFSVHRDGRVKKSTLSFSQSIVKMSSFWWIHYFIFKVKKTQLPLLGICVSTPVKSLDCHLDSKPCSHTTRTEHRVFFWLTRRSDSGVLSPSGKCCSRARTMQLAMMVARIIHSNGVRKVSQGSNTS